MRRLVLLLALLTTAVYVAPPLARGDQPVDYNRDIRPILAENCFACHGPDKSHRKADLRLDVRDVAVEAEAIVPGKPDDSELVERIFSDDPDVRMPPPDSKKKLSNQQKERLKAWIASGAQYAVHWSYAPLRRPAVPQVQHPEWVANPIDAFVLQMLEQHNLKPSPEAEPRQLLRRLHLDLVGLPPTPDDVQAFTKASSAGAYAHEVQQLLESPQYGERMASFWLDVVRYADTVGYHGDQNFNAWPYRDWVIDAFNANMPFDEFTIEQLAGDLLPDPTPEQLVATCFNRLNMMTREGGAQPKEYLAKYAADRVRTIGMAWLGSTLGCCECHDHKYDPFKARDFYSLEAFFADIKQWGVYQDYSYTPNPDLRGWSNDHPFPPEIQVESPYLKARIGKFRTRIRELVLAGAQKLDGDREACGRWEAWRTSMLAYLDQHPDGWLVVRPELPAAAAPPPAASTAAASSVATATAKTAPGSESAAAPELTVDDDGSVLFRRTAASNDQLRIALPPGPWAALRLELLPSPEHQGKIVRAGNDALIRLNAALRRRGSERSEPLHFYLADASPSAPRYSNGFALIGILNGWKTDGQQSDRPHAGVWLLEQPLTAAEGDMLLVDLPNNLAARVRVSISPLAPLHLNRGDLAPGLVAAVRNAASPPTEPDVVEAYLRSTAWDTSCWNEVRTLDDKIQACRDGMTPVMVTVSTKPLTVRLLPRGNWQDESGPVLEPAVPQFLPQPPTSSDQRLTRLDLAHWLVSPENPLTARVFVNRLWKQYFGQALSAQVDDLGSQGEWPLHADLLDWLAAEFRDSGWDVKHMVRLIVMSNTYRQSAQLRADLRESDPNNRLLASQSPRRLEAEVVRDNALAIAGLINLDRGGPPCMPYQPAGYYSNLQFPDRQYVADTDDRQYRRGVYMHWQRTFLHPFLMNFDAPSREDCIAARNVANTPQQALTLLNDPSIVEAARVWAGHLIAASSDDGERLELAFEQALCRSPQDKERTSLLAMLARAREEYRARPDDAAKILSVGLAPSPPGVDAVELAAWTNVCRVVLNLHETITRY